MIIAAVVAIVIVPLLGLALGVVVWRGRRRNGPQPDDVPLLTAAVIALLSQAVLDAIRDAAHVQTTIGSQPWAATMYLIAVCAGLGLARRYFSTRHWPLLWGIAVVCASVGYLPGIHWMAPFAVVGFVGATALPMMMMNLRRPSGRRTALGYALYILAAILLTLYPDVITPTSPEAVTTAIIVSDAALLGVIGASAIVRSQP